MGGYGLVILFIAQMYVSIILRDDRKGESEFICDYRFYFAA